MIISTPNDTYYFTLKIQIVNTFYCFTWSNAFRSDIEIEFSVREDKFLKINYFI